MDDGKTLGPVALTVGLVALGAAAWAAEPSAAAPAGEAQAIEVPALDGPWWQIAPNAPDVGPWATGQENACDFTVYRAADGAWHCVACIRGTRAPGERLFFRWTAPRLTDTNWRPLGILDVPRGTRGTENAVTSVQAPHAFRHDGKYLMFYNSGGGARCLVSPDGGTWTPATRFDGQPVFFAMGRDVNLFHDADHERWIAYYCGTVTVGGERRGAMVARTAARPEGPWSDEEKAVLAQGNPESPFVLKRDGHYYLFQQMSVYRSADPLDFNRAELVAHMTGLWFDGKYAPEIIEDGREMYIAGYSRGLHVAKVKWVRKTPAEVAAWREQRLKYLEVENAKRLEREKKRAAEKASGASATAAPAAATPPPVPLLFDTDMDSDCDDAAALAMLHVLADRGEVRILGTMVSSKHPWSAPCADAINTYYGRPDLPIGVPKGPGAHEQGSKYARTIAGEFPHDCPVGPEAPDATPLYRHLLAGEADGSVVLVTVGDLTNLRYLVESAADSSSPLSGRDLVARKVRHWVCMGSRYPADLDPGRWGNFKPDPESTVRAIAAWPTRIVFTGGGEFAESLATGRRLAELPKTHPVRRVYELYFGGEARNRHSADQIATYVAVRGDGRPWRLATGGSNHIFPNGTHEWRREPDNPLQGYISALADGVAPQEVTAEIESLMVTPPRNAKPAPGGP
jgi:hypothetical protein